MIRMYCVVAIDLPEQKVYDIALQSILYSFATFEFANFTPTWKVSLSCNASCMFYILDGLEFHQYSTTTPSFSSLSKSPDSWEERPSLSQKHVGICSTSLFKTQILPLEEKFCALLKAKNSVFVRSNAQKLTSNLHNIQFPPALHCLDSFWALFFTPDVTTKIGSLYDCLPFSGKYLLYQ